MITLTENAKEYLTDMVSKSEDTYARLSVKVEGNKFTDILKRDIGRMQANETVSFSRIVVKQDKCKACPEEKLESIMQFTIQ